MRLKPIFNILIGMILFSVGAVLNIVCSNTAWLNLLDFFLINFAFSIICFEVKINKALFYSMILDILSTATEFASMFIVSAFTNTDVRIYLDDFSFFIIDSLICKTLYFISCIILTRFIKKDKTGIGIPIAFYFYPFSVVAVLLFLWNIYITSGMNRNYKLILSVISTILLFSVVILFISYQHNIEKENRLFALQNELEKFETDKTYYEILEKQNENLMIYAHDAKKHLAAISKLNTNPRLNKYIGEMTDRLKEYSRTCHSGNHTLDVILDKYVTQCEISDVSFTFDVHLANFVYINDFDLVAIFSNLLDNALEAAKISEKKKIILSTDHKNTYDVLVISNSCDSPPIHREHHLKTTKANRNIHGLGLKSVKRTLKKYGGDFEWEYDKAEKLFTVTVLLLNE